MKLINPEALDRALRQANIPIDGVSADGRIDFQPSVTVDKRQQAADILATLPPYDPVAADDAQGQIVEDATKAIQALNGKQVSALASADVKTLLALWLAQQGWLTADGIIDVW